VRRLGLLDFSKGDTAAAGIVTNLEHTFDFNLPSGALSEIWIGSEIYATSLVWVYRKDHSLKTCFYLGCHLYHLNV
jgi:hypothetical protein